MAFFHQNQPIFFQPMSYQYLMSPLLYFHVKIDSMYGNEAKVKENLEKKTYKMFIPCTENQYLNN